MNITNMQIHFGAIYQPQGQSNSQIPSWIVKRGWNVVNIDKREYIALSMQSGDRATTPPFPGWLPADFVPPSADDMSKHQDFADAVWPLIMPVMVPHDSIVSRKTTSTHPGESEHAGAPHMLNLPFDVQTEIFEAIDSIRDATALSLTNTALLHAGQRRVRELSRRTWAAWSGDRIIALPGRQDAQFWDEHAARCFCTDRDLAADVEAAGGLAAYLEQFSVPRRPRARCPPSVREIARSSPQFDWRRFGGVGLVDYPLAAWVICNLSRREYVRIVPFQPFKDPDGSQRWLSQRCDLPFYLAKSVAVRVFCSSAETGGWAADQIAIYTEDGAQNRHKNWQEWKNVTARNDDPRTLHRCISGSDS